MLRSSILVWLSAFSVVLSPLAALPTPIHAQQKEIDAGELERTALAELTETKTPGAAVVVVSGDRVVFAKGFGVANIETGVPVTPDTLFRIGTITAIFTAAALVSLADEGRLKLDEPIGKYVRGLNSRLSQVNAHQLLTHTAGIKEEHAAQALSEDTALGRTLRSWTDEYCLSEPGKMYSHSNPGYALAGLQLESVVGEPFADAMKHRLFDPLGMTRTTFRPAIAMTYPISQGHVLQPTGKVTVLRPYAQNSFGWPSGSLFSSGNDLARFVIAFLNDGKLEDKQVFSRAAISKLSNAYADLPSVDQNQKSGYGWVIYDYRGLHLLTNQGSWAGFTPLIWLVPEHRFGVIVLSNRSGGTYLTKTARKALELMLPLGPSSAAPPFHSQMMTDAEMAKYVGTYANENTAEIQLTNGHLFLKENNLSMPIIKVGQLQFAVTIPGTSQTQTFVLLAAPDGTVEYLHRFGRAMKKLQRTDR